SGGGALELMPLARQLRAGGDEQVRQQSAQLQRGLLLVLRREVGVEEADRQRLDPVALEQISQCAERGLVERRSLPAAALDALLDLEAPFARHQRWLAVETQVERLGPVAPPDLQNVAEALGGDEGGAGAGPLQQRVDDERRAVLDDVRLPC